MNYLHNILSRNEDDLLLRVFNAQCESPLDGDFIKLIEKDFEMINVPYKKSLVTSMNKKQFKKWIKLKIEKAAFSYLINEKESDKNKKIQNIIYKNLRMQKYLKSQLFSNSDIELLFKLRSKTVDVKINFKTKYANSLTCPLNGCNQEDSQEHIFESCEELLKRSKNDKVKHKQIFSNTKNQFKAVKNFKSLMEMREKLLSEDLYDPVSPSNTS